MLEEKLKMINETIPTRVYNTSSSSAGAGSGDFHQYRMVRGSPVIAGGMQRTNSLSKRARA